MSLKPRESDDLTGWHELTCDQSDVVMGRHFGLPTFTVAVEYTDTDAGEYYREWWFNGVPLLREYRDSGRCRHYGAMDATAAVERAS